MDFFSGDEIHHASDKSAFVLTYQPVCYSEELSHKSRFLFIQLSNLVPSSKYFFSSAPLSPAAFFNPVSISVFSTLPVCFSSEVWMYIFYMIPEAFGTKPFCTSLCMAWERGRGGIDKTGPRLNINILVIQSFLLRSIISRNMTSKLIVGMWHSTEHYVRPSWSPVMTFSSYNESARHKCHSVSSKTRLWMGFIRITTISYVSGRRLIESSREWAPNPLPPQPPPVTATQVLRPLRSHLLISDKRKQHQIKVFQIKIKHWTPDKTGVVEDDDLHPV